MSPNSLNKLGLIGYGLVAYHYFHHINNNISKIIFIGYFLLAISYLTENIYSHNIKTIGIMILEIYYCIQLLSSSDISYIVPLSGYILYSYENKMGKLILIGYYLSKFKSNDISLVAGSIGLTVLYALH
jgi:hypothetical protein